MWSTKLIYLVLLSTYLRAALGNSQCEPMTFDECSFGKAHKMTAFPNKKGDQNMEDAKKQYDQFRPLVNFRCSPYLKELLCFYMFPGCSSNDPQGPAAVLFPCRSLCEQVRRNCEKISSLSMQPVGFTWDITDIHCDYLPDKNSGVPCIDAEETASPNNTVASNTVPAIAQRTASCGLVAKSRKNHYVQRCGADVLYDAETKRFADVWISVWSTVCFAASLLTFVTILRDKQRFMYPERPVMFLSLCYLGYSIAYLVRALAGAQAVSCERNNNNSCDVLVREEMQPLCMVVFIVGYFFSLSAAFWWLMFTVGWLLSAAVKWSPEAIEARSSYFHVFAWATPACFTSIIIVMRKVEGDELTGMCMIGVSNASDLLIFQIIPHALLLFVSLALLVAGFVALTRIRNELAENCKLGTDKLEKLIVKVAVSAALYVVPTLATLACNIYQYANLASWNDLLQRAHERPQRPVADLPPAELFIFRIFMSFAVGISMLMWVCSVKTLRSWRDCLVPRAASHAGKLLKRDAPTSYAPLASVTAHSHTHSLSSPTATATATAAVTATATATVTVARSAHPSSSTSRSNQQTRTTAALSDPFPSPQSSSLTQQAPLSPGSPPPTTASSTMPYFVGYANDDARLASVHALPQQAYNVPYRVDQNGRMHKK